MNLENCLDCKGTGEYVAKNGDSWTCEFCCGDKLVPAEVAEEQKQKWQGYKSMMEGYVDVED